MTDGTLTSRSLLLEAPVSLQETELIWRYATDVRAPAQLARPLQLQPSFLHLRQPRLPPRILANFCWRPENPSSSSESCVRSQSDLLPSTSVRQPVWPSLGWWKKWHQQFRTNIPTFSALGPLPYVLNFCFEASTSPFCISSPRLNKPLQLIHYTPVRTIFKDNFMNMYKQHGTNVSWRQTEQHNRNCEYVTDPWKIHNYLDILLSCICSIFDMYFSFFLLWVQALAVSLPHEFQRPLVVSFTLSTDLLLNRAQGGKESNKTQSISWGKF